MVCIARSGARRKELSLSRNIRSCYAVSTARLDKREERESDPFHDTHYQ